MPVLAHFRPGLAQRLEPMLPDACFLQGPEEALDESIFVLGTGRREILDAALGLYRRNIIVPTIVCCQRSLPKISRVSLSMITAKPAGCSIPHHTKAGSVAQRSIGLSRTRCACSCLTGSRPRPRRACGTPSEARRSANGPLTVLPLVYRISVSNCSRMSLRRVWTRFSMLLLLNEGP